MRHRSGVMSDFLSTDLYKGKDYSAIGFIQLPAYKHNNQPIIARQGIGLTKDEEMMQGGERKCKYTDQRDPMHIS